MTDALAAALAEQHAGWDRGEPVPAEEVLRLHPELAAVPDAVLEVAYNEAILRERHGLPADLPDLQRRFPHVAAELAVQWRVDQAVVASRPDQTTLPAPRSAAAVPLPTHIGRYQIQGLLGTGGMGVVYLAWDPDLARPLAVKRVKGESHSPQTLARFRTEATAIAQFHHPNVVQVFDVGDADGSPFLAMEFCDGGTLADRLKAGPLPPTEAAAVAAEIARGVAAAHAKSVLHRDLKPGNVLLAPPPSTPGRPVCKVTDFGLAKDLTATDSPTETGAIPAPPTTCHRSKRSAGRTTSARRPTCTPSARSCTSRSPAARRSAASPSPTPSPRCGGRSRWRCGGSNRPCRGIWKPSA